jgi:hypothetical protein
MKTINVALRSRIYLLVIAAIAVIALSSLTILSRARFRTSTVTVVNNSSREIRHLFLSPPDSDNWSPDQLHESTITPGHSFALSPSCNQANIKVIAEDQDGCFIYQVVSCSEDSTWTITNDTTRDCGGN